LRQRPSRKPKGGEEISWSDPDKCKFTIPMGSYLLILHKKGFHPVRCPVFIARNGEESVDATLYRDGEIPAGFVQVPAGKFIYQGDKENPYSGPKEIKEIEDCFIAKFPVTCREYLEFLNDVASRDLPQAEKRAPRKSATAGVYWPHDGEGRFMISTEKWMAEAPEGLKKQASKLEMSPVWWEEDWPVFGVSREDLMAFSARKTRKTGTLVTLPHEIPWEKAARGTDGRFFPFGNVEDATFMNTNLSHENGQRPTVVDSFSADESPYGAKGLGGNSRDICLNDPGEKYVGWRLARGGGWTSAGIDHRSAFRSGSLSSDVDYGNGGRVSWCSRCSTPNGSRNPAQVGGLDVTVNDPDRLHSLQHRDHLRSGGSSSPAPAPPEGSARASGACRGCPGSS
jgi:formylglycine-generating enzyme required for sulfatase activity